jgi:(S)-2-hydroxyglutarate dehydrogenase
VYDFIIIGSGIVGLSVGMTLAQNHPKIRIAILEKENSFSCHQSGHNSVLKQDFVVMVTI